MPNTIELYANNARTTLAGSANNTVTTLVLQSGAGALFPSPNNTVGEYAKATLQDSATGLRNEIVYITARTGDVLTVIRGQDGSTAQTWSAGDTVFEGVTAATLASFVQPSKLQSGEYIYADATGTTSAYIATLTPAIATVNAGMVVRVNTNSVGTNTTTTPTLNVNGLGAFTIVKQGGALRVGDMPTLAQLQYDSTLTQWVLLNPETLTSGLVASGINIVTTTSALTTAMSGGLVRFNSATAIIPTLPASNTYAVGKTLKMMSNGVGVATVTCAGSDVINVGTSTVTTLAMSAGDTLDLMSDGAGIWYAVGGTVALRYSNTFKNGTRYSRLPDGTIIQRGSIAGVGLTWSTVTLPIAWTIGGDAPVATVGDSSASSYAVIGAAVGLTGFQIRVVGTAGVSVGYIATGK